MKITINKIGDEKRRGLRVDVEDVKQFTVINTPTQTGFQKTGTLVLKSGEQFSRLTANCAKSLQQTLKYFATKFQKREVVSGRKKAADYIYQF